MGPSSIRDISPVIDQTLPPRAQRRLGRLIRRAENPADKMAIEYLGPVGVMVCIIGWFLAGLAAPWFWAAAIAGLIWLAIRVEVPSGALARRRDRFVDPSSLDGACLRLLGTAQCAIKDVVTAEVHRDGQLDHPASLSDLRWHEWEIARQLRVITKLGAEYAEGSAAGIQGPQTAAVLKAHRRAIEIAWEATSRRVAALVRYAGEVKAADAALKDWQTALTLAARNDAYLDLAASSEADRNAVAEIRCMTAKAILTREAFVETVNRAALAAQALVLPEHESCQPEQVCSSSPP